VDDLARLRENALRLQAWVEYDVHTMASFLFPETPPRIGAVEEAYEALRDLESDLLSRAPFGTVLTTPDEVGRIQEAAGAAMHAVNEAIHALELEQSGNGAEGSIRRP
jgi:hypothetical protein